MPIRTALWKVTAQSEQLPEAVLPSEKLLEDMIVAQPLLLSACVRQCRIDYSIWPVPTIG